jgi:hypothetical protein
MICHGPNLFAWVTSTQVAVANHQSQDGNRDLFPFSFPFHAYQWRVRLGTDFLFIAIIRAFTVSFSTL